MTLREAIFSVLDEGEAYGLEVMTRVNQMPAAPWAHIGNTYPTLRAMEKEGLVEGRWTEPLAERGGRPRRYYRRVGP